MKNAQSVETIAAVFEPARAVPLVVDLDGSLLRSDMLVETFAAGLSADFGATLRTLSEITSGKAALKAALADANSIDPSTLPYDADVLELIRTAKSTGRQVYLASASNEGLVARIARHLGLFDGSFGSTRMMNLGGRAKAELLVHQFGEAGFDYVGDAGADLAVWRHARRKVAIRPSLAVKRALLRMDANADIIEDNGATWRDWVRLVRVHQYAKNLLLAVPFLAAHRLDLPSLAILCGIFVAFSLCASAIYIVNDLVDLSADRVHPTKSARPLAAGRVPILNAALLALGMLVVAFGISLLLSRSLEPAAQI